LLRQVEEKSLRAGLGPLLSRARRSLRQVGLSPIEDSARPSTDVLTAAERKVLEAARTGASNSEIARHLGMSPSTVTYHFRRIERKLGTDSRHGSVSTADRLLRSPLVVVRGNGEAFSATVAAMRAAGWNVTDAQSSTAPATSDPRIVRAWKVKGRSDAESVLLDALAGQGVVVHLDTDSELAEHLLADLRRVALIDVRGEHGEQLCADLSPDDQALLDMLAVGLPTEGAARRLGWSRRTVYRRLARIRDALHVGTTADAIATYVHQSRPT
jgi:DNA-binding NarL/FixJ family response regulator